MVVCCGKKRSVFILEVAAEYIPFFYLLKHQQFCSQVKFFVEISGVNAIDFAGIYSLSLVGSSGEKRKFEEDDGSEMGH